MPNYRRSRCPGGTFFFTVVTADRTPFLTGDSARSCLRAAIAETRDRLPFRINSWVLLPDHIHCIWTLPVGDGDFSKRWGMIKAGFSKRFSTHVSEDMRREHGGFWQKRFWEHRIRNDNDFRRHTDYVHWNPVKHGLVDRVGDWPYSTFHSYVRRGVYPEDWGQAERNFKGSFGE